MRKKLVSLLCIAAMITSLAGCSNSNKDTEEYTPKSKSSSTTEETSTPDKSGSTVQNYTSGEFVTIADIKNKYGTLDTVEIKPFYNVEQTTQFTFHFNAKDIEPCHAVTVHTDSKCEENSSVYQINDGYLVNDGIDVVVKPGFPVLQEKTQDTEYTWGKAPVYYLSINYDMEATTPTKLDKPIVVPFTIRSDVSTPNIEASIDTTGRFQIQWKPVTGATKYNIYETQYVRRDSSSFGMLRAECGYAGDHLDLIATVDASTTVFDGFALDNGESTLTDSYGYIVSQNRFIPSNYFVAAVDSSGNESQYSMAVSGWKFESQLPDTFDSYTGFEKNDAGHVSKLPSEVSVKMKDGSYGTFPINFKKLSEQYGCATYEYEIVGTLLTGKIEYENENQDYPSEVKSQATVNYGIYEVKNDINIVPENTLNTVNDDAYSNSVVKLDKQVDYPEASKLVYSQEALLRRADIEGARTINDGTYNVGSTPSSIETYKETAQSATPYIKDEKQPSSSSSSSEQQPSSSETEQSAETSETSSSETVQPEIPDEITSENLVQEQIESTQREVEEANNNTAPKASVVYFADSAEEEYMALMMIGRQEIFDISAFPSLQNTEYLVDVIQKVIYQNPYIISPKGFAYSAEEKLVAVDYAFSPEETFERQVKISEEVDSIVSSIITNGMSNEEKVNAVWDYLESTTKYDDAALQAAEASNFESATGYEDSFNAYGILCNKVGVCQSYSYSYKLLLDAAGVPCVTLTGYLDKTLPHAWNAVQLDGQNWYWLDATNNKNVTGIPYYLYQTSSTSALNIDYVLDDQYELDSLLQFVITEDNSKDWWYENGLCVESALDLAHAFEKSYKNGPIEIDGMKALAVKNIGGIQDSDLTEVSLRNMIQTLLDAGMSENDIMNSQMFQFSGYIMLVY